MLSCTGYGGLSPESVYCNVLVCIQAFWGMLSTAIITGTTNQPRTVEFLRCVGPRLGQPLTRTLVAFTPAL